MAEVPNDPGRVEPKGTKQPAPVLGADFFIGVDFGNKTIFAVKYVEHRRYHVAANYT